MGIVKSIDPGQPVQSTQTDHGQNFSLLADLLCINPLPDLQILGFSNSAANNDMMSNIWTNRDTIT